MIIGGGNRERYMRQGAQRIGILDRSFFMLGPKPKMDLPRWLSASTMTMALINGPEALWANATQNKFFDSLTAERPVACNFRGYQAITAEESGCGFILDNADPEGAASTMVTHLHDSEWLSMASERALSLATGEFNRDNLAVELNGLLEQVVAAGCCSSEAEWKA